MTVIIFPTAQAYTILPATSQWGLLGKIIELFGPVKTAALERLGKISDALTYFTQVCEKSRDIFACAGVLRLRLPKSKNPWVGLYHSPQGPLLVSNLEHGKVSIHFETLWQNYYECGWEGTGVVSNGNLLVDKVDAECQPVITRAGNTLKVSDPDGSCQDINCGAHGHFDSSFELSDGEFSWLPKVGH